MSSKTFVTSVHCMDGRIQQPLIDYMKSTYAADYVDAITEAGPLALLDVISDPELADNVYARIDISRDKHGSKALAISGHHDCAGNPAEEWLQVEQLHRVASQLRERYPHMDVVCLYVDETWSVKKIDA